MTSNSLNIYILWIKKNNMFNSFLTYPVKVVRFVYHAHIVYAVCCMDSRVFISPSKSGKVCVFSSYRVWSLLYGLLSLYFSQ